jgi:hypothetical protein
MKQKLALAVAVLALLGTSACRTHVSSVRAPKPAPVYVGDRSCMVQDFASATEVPEGAKNLGWVSVPDSGDDEKTYIHLREKVCGMEGDALSQVAWVQEEAESALVLKANAWQLP